jgi:Tfp pilus assembly protein PilO
MKVGLSGPSRFDIREEWLKVSIFLGVVAVANLILYAALNLPRMHREATEEGRVTVLTQNLGEVSRRVGLMKDLDQRFEGEKTKVKTFYDDVLGTKDGRMIQIQREVRAIAASLGMDPETIAYQPEYLDKVGLVRFGINVPLSGDYRNLRQFINKIEKSENFLIVDSVTLSGAKDGGALLDLNIHLTTFFDSPELRMMQAAEAEKSKAATAKPKGES